VSLFADLSEETLVNLGAKCERLRLAAGETLIQEGESGDHLYFVIGGVLRVERYTVRGGTVHVAMRSTGETIGELSILTDGLRTAYVVAHTACRILSMSRTSFQDYALTQPDVVRILLSTLAMRVREATELLVNRSGVSVEDRVLQAMLSLADSKGEISFNESQSEFAERLGCSRETLNRCIAKLVASGKIRKFGPSRYQWNSM
jgi:CRP/FNR family transcriptional regulator, cyclic AMP receptor protein